MAEMFKHVRAGDPLAISAGDYNGAMDAARAHRERERGTGREAKPSLRQGDVVLIRNDSGGDADRFGVLGIDGPVVDPADDDLEFKGRVALSGVEPTRADHLGVFSVLLEPIADGKTGIGQVSGVCVAKVNVVDAAHRYADVTGGSAAQLTSANLGGAQILWKSGTGSQFAVVKLGVAPLVKFDAKLSGAAVLRYRYVVAVDDDPNEGEDYTFTATVDGNDFEAAYTVQAGDGAPDVAQGLADAINAGSGDPWDDVAAAAVGATVVVNVTNENRALSIASSADTTDGSGGGGVETSKTDAAWRYTFTEVVRLGEDWVAPASPITGTALNRSEEPNDGAGVEGTGVTVGSVDGVFVELLPADTGAPVVEVTARFDANGDEVFTFEFQNEIDVTCGSGS